MDKISTFISTYFDWFYITVPGTVDIIEILILSFFIYRIMLWFKQSRAWTLLKGIVMIVLFTAIAAVFQFNTILYLLKNAFSVGIIAVVILFQPEFRHGAYRGARKCRANHQLFYNAGYHRNHCESERLFRLPLLYNRYGCNRYSSEKRA